MIEALEKEINEITTRINDCQIQIDNALNETLRIINAVLDEPKPDTYGA